MRIGIDIRGTQFESSERGIGKYIITLVNGVSQRAPEDEFLLIAFPDLPIPSSLFPLLANCRIVPFPARPISRRNWYHRVPRGWRLYHAMRLAEHRRLLKQIAAREKLDLLHLTDIFDGNFYSGGRPHCRVVVTLYDLIPLVMADHAFKLWDLPTRFQYGYHLKVLQLANEVVAISESSRRDAIQYAGLRPERLKTVLCAIPDDFSSQVTAEARQECLDRFGIRSPYFLFCSGADVNKNRDRVLLAFSQFINTHPASHLVITGPVGSRPILDAFKVLAFDHGLDRDHLILAGYVADVDLAALFSGAVALVTPSLYEGFGLPAAQALQIGTPVIASNRSSQPEVVGDAGLLVDPEQTGAIAEAMLCLADAPDLCAELAARGKLRAKLFERERQAQAMLTIYRGC